MSLSRPIQRLSDATLASLPPQVARPAYDRARTRIGVVHFGPGAFHRAHQAFYFDRMLATDPGMAISAVSLRSDAVRAALAPQDGLYSLIEREAEPTIRVIGAIPEVLTAPADPQAVLRRLADPNVRFVTATVTEKGYGLTPAGDLDLGYPQVEADLARPSAPRTLVGWLTAGLKQRRAAGGAGLTVLSCDNLSGNGGLLRRASLQFAQACGEADLACWIDGEVRFHDSMVDSITPATDAPLRVEAQAQLGLSDAWPIQRERFVQWVIGGDLGPDAEIFASAGVTLAADVAPFERAKLRLLNGAHSTLAYIGLRLGHQTVAQAMGDARLAAFVEALMREDIAPSLTAPPGLDLDGYIGQILQRFRNPAIDHRLSQIAWDGSQKLPVRLLATVADALAAGRPVARLATGLAAWMAFVVSQTRQNAMLQDPMAGPLADLGRAAAGDPAHDVAAFLTLTAIFPPALAADVGFRQAVETAYARLMSATPTSAVTSLVGPAGLELPR